MIEADILLHVVDVSHPAYADQINVVNETLQSIEAKDKPTILVFNKVDKLEFDVDETMEGLQNSLTDYYKESGEDEVVFISAIEKDGIDGFKKILHKKVKKRYMEIYPNYIQPETYLPEEN